MAPGEEERRSGGWLPPLEARELGSGVPAAGRYKLSPLSVALIVVVLGILSLVVIGRVISLAEGPREDSSQGVVTERIDFMAGCTDRAASGAYCRCVFDKLAEEGRATRRDFDELSRGGLPGFVQEAAAVCGARR